MLREEPDSKISLKLAIFKKWAIPGLFFLYFSLSNTADSK